MTVVPQVKSGIVQDQVLPSGEGSGVLPDVLHPDDGIVIAILHLADQAGALS